MKKIIAGAVLALALSGCGQDETIYRDDQGTCMRHRRSWMIWQVDSSRYDIDQDNCSHIQEDK